MALDIHDQVIATQRVAKQARKRTRKRALKTLETARALDLHEPAEAAKAAAKRAARRTGKRAAAASGRAAARTSSRTGRRMLRGVVLAVAAGAAVAVAVAVARKIRSTPVPQLSEPGYHSTVSESDAETESALSGETPATATSSGAPPSG
jgi:hypothetical protein